MDGLHFAYRDQFEAKVPGWGIKSHDYAECFSFLNSGGLNSRPHSLHLTEFAYPVIKAIDSLFMGALRSLFGLGQRVVVQRGLETGHP